MDHQNKTKIDFSVLDSLKTDKLNSSVIFVLALIMAFSIFVGPYIIGTLAYFIAIPIGIGLAMIRISKARTSRHNVRTLMNFCINNKFGFNDSSFHSRPGTLFHFAAKQHRSREITGFIHGLPFSLYRYIYSDTYDNNAPMYELSIMEIKLPRTLPHIVIDSMIEEKNEVRSALPITFDNSQKIELEGDFYKYFHLYAPSRQGVKALTILAPDAMETLMQYATTCDIEIIDDRIYFYWPNFPLTRADYETIFNTTDQVLAKIRKKLIHVDLAVDPHDNTLVVEPTQRLRLNHHKIHKIKLRLRSFQEKIYSTKHPLISSILLSLFIVLVAIPLAFFSLAAFDYYIFSFSTVFSNSADAATFFSWLTVISISILIVIVLRLRMKRKRLKKALVNRFNNTR